MQEDKFLDFVHNEARKIGMEFFLDSGEGRDCDFDGMYCEDLSGWLIKPDQREELIATPQSERYDGEIGECYVFALWRIENGKMKIEFRRYDDF